MVAQHLLLLLLQLLRSNNDLLWLRLGLDRLLLLLMLLIDGDHVLLLTGMLLLMLARGCGHIVGQH